MQKAIPPRLVEPYLAGRRAVMAGFVYRVQDSSFTHPAEYYEALDLGYDGSDFAPDLAQVYVLRWQAVSPQPYQVPYSRERGGDWSGKPPFTGTGFTSSPAHPVAEFYLDPVPVPAGAEMHRVRRDGSELIARVPIQEVQALWESKPMGTFRGDRCLVLDDLGDQLHIAYLGHDGYQADELGYRQVDRGVFELVTPRDEVTEIFERRPDYRHRPLPLEAAARRAASARGMQRPRAPEPEPEPQAPRRRRSALRRVATQRIFSELAGLAAIPPSAYAVGEEVDGAMCLIQTPDGFEVFNAAAGARHEVRLFDDEESAYFYLFGILAAEAVRTGRLAPRA